MSAEKVELGRRLFFDTRLSGNGSQACASCHRPEKAFTDGRPQAIGSTGQTHRRGAMSLTNVAYAVSLTWAGPDVRRLEDQALIPMRGTHPVELGMAGREPEILARLEADERYPAQFHASFPGETRPIRIDNITRAVACFERTLVSGDSPYDRVVFQGQMDAMSEAAWRGMRLFFSDRLACSKCHAGFNFSGPVDYAGLEGLGIVPEPAFHNTALYDVDGRGSYPAADTGLSEATGRRRDMGRFKAPTLRNIAVTAPYMHDGSIATLQQVIEHYARGGRATATARGATKEATRYRSPLLRGFAMNDQEEGDLVAFLESLTDETFLRDPRFAPPSD